MGQGVLGICWGGARRSGSRPYDKVSKKRAQPIQSGKQAVNAVGVPSNHTIDTCSTLNRHAEEALPFS